MARTHLHYGCVETFGQLVDVFEEEPPEDIDFIALNNLACTPHIGGNSDEAVLAMGRSAIFHLEKFFSA